MELVVPPLEEEPFPSLGGQVISFLEREACFGPGSLKGEPLVLSGDAKLVLWKAYEVWPQGHPRAGRRRFNRVGISVRKGAAKTELMALVAFAELHPEGPVRFAGWDASQPDGLADGRPVRDPYIPLLANTKDQVEELAYGALMVICELCKRPEFFDANLERILRVVDGEPDGKAVAIAGAPNAADGARTTFQGWDETHRLYLPNHKAAVQTMENNLPKRPEEDPWTLATTTSGEPGQDSVAEDHFFEAEAISRGEIDNPTLFYFHRQASDGYDTNDFDQRVAAIAEASGPELAARSDLHRIAAMWDQPKADKTYLERVWMNRWIAQEAQAFNPKRWNALGLKGERIPRKSHVTIGFDGARMRDSTAFVVTDIKTGFQQLGGFWERPLDAEDGWEIDELEVTEAFNELMRTYRVHKVYCDPPYWSPTIGEWAVKYPDIVLEWWTNKHTRMIAAIQGFSDAINMGKLSHDGDPDLARHVANAGKHMLNGVRDENGERKWILGKLHPDRKFDACMAAILSWQARMDELGTVKKTRRVVQRIR